MHRFLTSSRCNLHQHQYASLSPRTHCRDIKPENLLLLDNSENSPLKIADFGVRLARVRPNSDSDDNSFGFANEWGFRLALGRPFRVTIVFATSERKLLNFLNMGVQVATWSNNLAAENFPKCGTPGELTYMCMHTCIHRSLRFKPHKRICLPRRIPTPALTQRVIPALTLC